MTLLTDHDIAKLMNRQSLQGGNNDSPWWLLFARDVERLTLQQCALEQLADESQRLGLYADNTQLTTLAELRHEATRALVAWDGTVLPKAHDGLMQERMECLRAALDGLGA